MIRLLHGDCIERLRELPEESVHAVVTDPPYHLTTSKKGGRGLARVNLDTPHGRARITTGFMGMGWDGGDVAMRAETWAAVLRVLKPGGYLLAFGGTRTYHRLVCAIEDSGFEVRDMIAWLYGSGFPKGTDKAKIPPEFAGFNTALKPAIEPIVVARKPMIGTLAANLQAHGCGAMNVNGCRVEVLDPGYARNCSGDRGHEGTRSIDKRGEAGRWPANVVHDGSEEVVALFPSEAGAAAPVHRRGADKFRQTYGTFAGNIDEEGSTFHGDSGSAARFFYCAKASREDRNDGLHHRPAKALNWSSGEQNPGTFQSPNTNRQAQNHHPTVKPTELMAYLVRLVTPPGGTVLDPFMGSGSTGRGAALEGMDFIGIEFDAGYLEIARQRIRAISPLFAEVA